MKNAYVIAMCTQSTQDNKTPFSFRGYFESIRIDSLVLTSNELKFQKNTEYVVHLSDITITDNILYATAIKRKLVFS